jgi:hypothetical protein
MTTAYHISIDKILGTEHSSPQGAESIICNY